MRALSVRGWWGHSTGWWAHRLGWWGNSLGHRTGWQAPVSVALRLRGCMKENEGSTPGWQAPVQGIKLIAAALECCTGCSISLSDTCITMPLLC